MMSTNRIKPISSEVNIPIEVKKDINAENTISLQPQLYEDGIPMFSKNKLDTQVFKSRSKFM